VSRKDKKKQDLLLVLAEIPVHNLPKSTTTSPVKYTSALFPSQYYVYLPLDFKVKSIYGTQISKYVISTE